MSPVREGGREGGKKEVEKEGVANGERGEEGR